MKLQTIQNKIYEIRSLQVMFDFNLAELYEVETRIFIQALKRNLNRFPEDFMFQLTETEWNDNRSQIVIGSQKHRNRKYLPYVFTEHGVTIMASILKSSKAQMMNIAIVRAFVALRKFVIQHNGIVAQLAELEKRVGNHDTQLNQIYTAIETLLEQERRIGLERESGKNRV